MEWEKIFANHLSDKGLIPKYVRNHSIAKHYTTQNKYHSKTNKSPNNLIKKWTEDLNRYLTKEDVKVVSEHMKICSTWIKW